jgi:hypothetical protein
MVTRPKNTKRLELLNQAQPDRPWSSCSEQRRCVICENVFSGDEVIVRNSRQRGVRLACPKCGSAPALWVRLGNPLVDQEVWADWESLMECASGDDSDDRETGVAAVS